MTESNVVSVQMSQFSVRVDYKATLATHDNIGWSQVLFHLLLATTLLLNQQYCLSYKNNFLLISLHFSRSRDLSLSIWICLMKANEPEIPINTDEEKRSPTTNQNTITITE